MSMIRINLIAERKAGAPKAVKKPTGQASELQENMVLIVSVLLAFATFMTLRHFAKTNLNNALQEEKRLKAEYEKYKHWKDKKLEYEIQKELLNEKIERISELKDRRQGPVKLMEDIANVLPDSVWLGSVSQGYRKSLLAPTAKGRAKASRPKSVGKNTLVKVTGYANSHEAITNFANKVISLDASYQRTDLNVIKRGQGAGAQEYGFQIYFEIRKKKK